MGREEVTAVVFLPAQTPIITGSIKLPGPVWRLLAGVRTSATDQSCLATQGPEKKARKQREGQREVGWQRKAITRRKPPYTQA